VGKFASILNKPVYSRGRHLQIELLSGKSQFQPGKHGMMNPGTVIDANGMGFLFEPCRRGRAYTGPPVNYHPYLNRTPMPGNRYLNEIQAQPLYHRPYGFQQGGVIFPPAVVHYFPPFLKKKGLEKTLFMIKLNFLEI
jgi:hypothetical protein